MSKLMGQIIMGLIGWGIVVGSAWELPTANFAAVMLGVVIIAASRHGS